MSDVQERFQNLHQEMMQYIEEVSQFHVAFTQWLASAPTIPEWMDPNKDNRKPARYHRPMPSKGKRTLDYILRALQGTGKTTITELAEAMTSLGWKSLSQPGRQTRVNLTTYFRSHRSYFKVQEEYIELTEEGMAEAQRRMECVNTD